MAGMNNTLLNNDDDMNNTDAAELSKNDDLVEFIQVNSLEALKARFGAADEDESIRNEGFELAKKGGLVRKPRPENEFGYYSSGKGEKDDVPTDSDSELSKVFDSAKSEFDGSNVSFGDLQLDSMKSEEEENREEPVEEPKKDIEEPEKKQETKKKRTAQKKSGETDEAGEEKKQAPKRRRTAKKNADEEKQEEIKAEELSQDDSDEEITQVVKKYNTHTKVIFVDESLSDGIKKNSDSELEGLFSENGTERRRLWSRRKK